MKKGLLGSLVAGACLSLTATGAMAVPFVGFPDLEISASLDVNGDSDFAGSDAFQEGTLSGGFGAGTSGGSADIETLPPPSFGTLPIAGTLASFGDFVDVSVDGGGEEITDFALVALFSDLSLDLVNSSTTDTLKITFSLDVEGTAEASGDAFSEVSIIIEDGSTTFTDISGMADGVFGPPSFDPTGLTFFDVTVGPSSSAMLSGTFDIFGTTLSTGGTFFTGFSATLQVFDVMTLQGPPPPPTTSVPEPGALALFGIGLLGLGAIRRRRRAIP